MSLSTLSVLEKRPAFEYVDCEAPVAFELMIPQRFWRYRSSAQGGHDSASSGVGESWVILHERQYRLRIRLTEEEWVEDFEPMMRTLWGQWQVFTVQLDANDPTTAKSVRLVEPWFEMEPEPTEFSGVLEVEMLVASDDGSAFEYPYYPSLAP